MTPSIRLMLFGLAAGFILPIVAMPTTLAQLTAGAAKQDITPEQLPVIVNGGFMERYCDSVSDRLHVRSLSISDGKTEAIIAIVDSCMIPRDVCDRIKAAASRQTGVPAERMLIAATHTHSAPSLMDFCLGSRRDPTYTEFAIPRIAECMQRAHSQRQPAEIGWAVAEAPEFTHCRRWIRRPDRVDLDPFGEPTVRAMMHPGYQNPDYLGPAGPVDAQLGLIAIRSTSGEPICIFTNYSMHYVGGVSGLSADYWGYFDQAVNARVRPKTEANHASPELVVMMSQGTSGDLHWMDYARPPASTTVEAFAANLAAVTCDLLPKVDYRRDLDLAMAESRMTLNRRLPSAGRLEWAAGLNESRGDRRPQNLPEVYAEQAAWIADHPQTELVLQSIRIGKLGITAIPNEVFGVTGLKLKAQSPLQPTFNLSLANGAEGYIPPPEQHRLGGYTTWPARTAGLEVEAEPKIVEQMLVLLETVSGKPRRPLTTQLYPDSILANMKAALGVDPRISDGPGDPSER